MSKLHGQSYLDLTVTPALRGYLLSHQPVVVFADKLEEIIWSNATGARLFGGTAIAELLAMKIPQTNPLIRQLHNAVNQMRDEASIVRGFQINQGMRSQLLQFSIDRIHGDDGECAYIVTHLSGDGDEPPTDHELAQFAVQAFDGLASAAAILDGRGIPFAQSADFDALSPNAKALASLVDELQGEEDRLIKRPVHLSDEKVVVVGLARLGNDNQQNLMVIAEPHESSHTEPEPDSGSVNVPVTSTHQEISDEPGTFEAPVTEFTQDIENLVDAPDRPDDEQDVPPDSREKHSELSQPVARNKSRDSDTRFAWSVDQDAVFTSVSDEMAALFGQSKTSLIGRSWEDLAYEYDLDPDGEIAILLDSRDTWSGKVVLWPLDDDGGEVAIELAALPAFDTDRQFSGFRGFGKILHRVMENNDFPDGSEHSQAPPPSAPIADDVSEPEIAISSLPAEDEPLYEPSEDTDSDANQGSNVLPFSRHAESNADLTEREQQALETVRDHLEDTNQDIGSVDTEKQIEDYDDEPGSDPSKTRPNTDILERLPVAVLVYRNETLLYANKNFLEFSRYISLEDLEESGGLSTLIGGEPVESGSTSSVLHLANGKTATINPVLHSIPWEGKKALLLSFNTSVPTETVEPDILEITRASEIQSILDTTNDGIILLEGDGSILSINAPAEALFGIEFTEAVGKRLEQLFAPESQSTIRGYVANVMEDGVESLINDGEEAIALEANGGIIPVFVTIAKMQSTGKLCAVLRDITNWKKAEEELIQSRKQAEESNEQKSEFLAKVSHEIRTPLNAIIGFSDVMIEERFGPIENDRYREYLLDIKRSGAHVLDIVNELLDLSRIEAGKLELAFEAVNLNEVVAETVALLQPEANSNRTIIRTSLSRSVPKIVADPRSIRQIILNLVSNAIKYSRTNSQVIVSTVYETNGEVALRVRDTGDGMTEDQIEEALQPFRQAHDLKENSVQGSGLGLPLTKALVEANRAYFELESEPGMGTIAHVQFPVQRVLGE